MAEAMREAHSIKGSALMLGFTDISQIAHQLEDLFVAAKQEPAVLDGNAFDVVFSAVDKIGLRVEALAGGEKRRHRGHRYLRQVGHCTGRGV